MPLTDDNQHVQRAMAELNVANGDVAKAQAYATLGLAEEVRMLTISVREGGNKVQSSLKDLGDRMAMK